MASHVQKNARLSYYSVMLWRMMAIIFGVAAAAILGAVVFPDSGNVLRNVTSVTVVAAGPSVSGSSQTETADIDPFKLARLINDVRRTQVDLPLKETWQKLSIEPGSFENCSNDCEARIYRHELNARAGTEVVLKLTRSFAFARFLVFTRAGDNRSWTFLGFVDHDFNKYEMARHRVARASGRTFLVIRGQEGSGSGYALYSETWYDANDGALKPVLSYPAEGHTYPWPNGLGREFKAKNLPDLSRSSSVTIQYTATYSPGDKSRLIFVNTHQLTYFWDNQVKKFGLDPKASNISEAEVAAIANIETEDEPKAGTKIGDTTFYSAAEARSFIGGGYEVFLKYNVGRLTSIATGRDAHAKAWLKQFLTECRDTDEKKALIAILGK